MLIAKNVTFGCTRDWRFRVPIEDVSLQLDCAERLYLAAPSGFGKTTLCKLLAGYEVPWSGEVLVDGERFPKKGVCPVQLIHQHPDQVLDPRMRMRGSLEEAGWNPACEADACIMERLGIRGEWLPRFPHELSGGELQRFCIARVLLAHPRYIIADEITTMLDAVSQAQIWKVLLEEVEQRRVGLLFTTHSKALAERIATRSFSLDA